MNSVDNSITWTIMVAQNGSRFIKDRFMFKKAVYTLSSYTFLTKGTLFWNVCVLECMDNYLMCCSGMFVF